MSVSNGQRANATTFNAAFGSKSADNTFIGNQDLNDPDAASGSRVANVQREFNSIWSAIGGAVGEVYNFTLTWASDIVGSANQTIKARIESIVSLFAGTGGHTHDGTDGDGSKVLTSSLQCDFDQYAIPYCDSGVLVGNLGDVAYDSAQRRLFINDQAVATRVIDYTYASPNLITAAGGIDADSGATDATMYIKGNGGVPIDITKNPQISPGDFVGQRLLLICVDDTATVQIDDGTGVKCNGTRILKQDYKLWLEWDGTNWSEISYVERP